MSLRPRPRGGVLHPWSQLQPREPRLPRSAPGPDSAQETAPTSPWICRGYPSTPSSVLLCVRLKHLLASFPTYLDIRRIPLSETGSTRPLHPPFLSTNHHFQEALQDASPSLPGSRLSQG